MGEQVNIYELAERMIRLCGYQPGTDIDIEITGRAPGENLTEQVVGPAERREADEGGPIVTITPVPLAAGRARGMARSPREPSRSPATTTPPAPLSSSSPPARSRGPATGVDLRRRVGRRSDCAP